MTDPRETPPPADDHLAVLEEISDKMDSLAVLLTEVAGHMASLNLAFSTMADAMRESGKAQTLFTSGLTKEIGDLTLETRKGNEREAAHNVKAVRETLRRPHD